MNKREIDLTLYALNKLECEARAFANRSKWKIWTKAERAEVKRHSDLADELARIRCKIGGMEHEEM